MVFLESLRKESPAVGATPSTPADETVVSRYMDLARFIVMLDNSGIFFATPDRLGDANEGKLGREDQNVVFKKSKEKYPGLSETQAFWIWLGDVWQPELQSVAVSCWYAGAAESHAMWRIYGAGVAINSTVGDIKAAFSQFNPEVRNVAYEAFESRPATDLNPLKVLSYKSPGFEHEREVRFFIRLTTDNLASLQSLREIKRDSDRYIWASESTNALSVRSGGVIAHGNISAIIKGVVISPTARIWERDAVYAIISKFGIDQKVVYDSSLALDPYGDIPFPL